MRQLKKRRCGEVFVGEVGEEAVDPLVGFAHGMDPLASDAPAAPAAEVEGVAEPLAPVAVPGRVNGILLGVAVPAVQ